MRMSQVLLSVVVAKVEFCSCKGNATAKCNATKLALRDAILCVMQISTIPLSLPGQSVVVSPQSASSYSVSLQTRLDLGHQVYLLSPALTGRQV